MPNAAKPKNSRCFVTLHYMGIHYVSSVNSQCFCIECKARVDNNQLNEQCLKSNLKIMVLGIPRKLSSYHSML